MFRAQVPLAPGANTISVEAYDAAEQRAALTLQVERLAASVRPVIQAVVGGCDRDEDGDALAPNREWFVSRASAWVRIDGSDPDATVLVNGSPVARDDAGRVLLTPILIDGQRVPCELVLENLAGRSAPFRCFPMLDTEKPQVEVEPLPAALAKGQPFDVRGTWVDEGGLRLVSIDGEPAQITPGRGAARRGEFVLRIAGVDGSRSLQLVVEDRAGNRLQLDLPVVVQ